MKNRSQKKYRDTSWERVAHKYNKIVGNKGHYFHENVILPKLLNLLNLKETSKLLDLACGQGILSKHLPKNVKYFGVDLSRSLIDLANSSKNFNAEFKVSDITKPINIDKKDFTHCTIVLALQNVENIAGVFQNAFKYLKPGGKFLMVINHPYFRIPRFTGWGIDEQNKQQYRKVTRYMSEQKIPIDMAPGSGQSKLTWSFHYPLSRITSELQSSGFMIENIEEWISDKTSEGKFKKMENLAREEFPMFMAISAVKADS